MLEYATMALQILDSMEFHNFCQEKGIINETSSAYLPQSNSLAESAVKQMKYLLKKCASWSEFTTALLEYRASPRNDGFSPSQLFFGRRPRTLLPALPKVYEPDQNNYFKGKMARNVTKEKSKYYYDRKTKNLEPLVIGQKVHLQNPVSLLWDKTGKITEVRENGRSYYVKSSEGGIYLRNRIFLRPFLADKTKR